MPTNKGALIRRQVLDSCLSSNINYTLLQLMEKCNERLREHGFKQVSSENTIRTDLAEMEDQFPEAEIVSIRDGRNIFYRYRNRDFSIYNRPMSDAEIVGLTQALSVLSRFDGMPGYEWLDSLLERFRTSISIDTKVPHVVGFDENIDLKGREHFAPLLQAILSKQVLLVRYVSYRTEKEFNVILHPWYLKQYNNRWFLFGLDSENNRLANLAFDRIMEFTTIPRSYIPNEEINFFEFFDDMVGVSRKVDDRPQEVRLHVSSVQLPYILSKPIHGTQRVVERTDDGAIISIQVILNYELNQLLLSLGQHVTVLSPLELRQNIAQRISQMNANYK